MVGSAGVRPKPGSLLWRIGRALEWTVGVWLVLNFMVFSWVELPQWVPVLISVVAALVVGLVVFIATDGKPRH